jgi:hypothetical protein
MTTLALPDPAGWATTGVDLETRRARILWGLATLGRTAEQRQFQSRYQAFMKIDEALADGYAQARYQHIIISLTTPGGAKRSGARDRRRDPQAFHQRTSTEVHPSPNRIQTDDHTGDEFDTAADPLRMPLRRQVAEVLERTMRDPARPTLPTEILLERRLAALRSKGGRHEVAPSGPDQAQQGELVDEPKPPTDRG